MTRASRTPCLALAWALLAAGACAGDPLRGARDDYTAGRYAAARDRLRELQDAGGGDAHLYAMERSLTELATREPRQAISALRFARDRADELGTGIADYFAAMLLDDRQLTYRPADYEQVMMRALLAAADLCADGKDAEAYALQVLQRQVELIDAFEARDGSKPKKGYELVPFGSYLRAIMAEESPLRLDEARRRMAEVLEMFPEFRDGPADLERMRSGRHSARGNGVVHVISLVGRGPYRVPSEEPVSGAVLAIAQWFWQIHRATPGRGGILPNITSVEIPALAWHADNPETVHVAIGGEAAGATAILTDVSYLAEREFSVMEPYAVARAVVRRAFKIAVTEGVREAVNPYEKDRTGTRLHADQWLDLGISLLGIVWTGVESADLRCWSLCPDTIQVLRIELPAGDHELTLRAASHGGPTGAPQRVRVRVEDGLNTYVLALTPTVRGGPPPLASRRATPAETTAASRPPTDQELSR